MLASNSVAARHELCLDYHFGGYEEASTRVRDSYRAHNGKIAHTPTRESADITFLLFGGGRPIVSGTVLFWLGGGAKTYAKLRLGSGSGDGASGHTTSSVPGRGAAADVRPPEGSTSMSLSSVDAESESLKEVKDDVGDSQADDGECGECGRGVCERPVSAIEFMSVLGSFTSIAAVPSMGSMSAACPTMRQRSNTGSVCGTARTSRS